MDTFTKMHGLGNDFALFDGRAHPLRLEAATITRLADRRRGIGFDQLVLVETSAVADARLRFFNADGSESGACGNGTRCAARWLAARSGQTRLRLEVGGAILAAEVHGDGTVTVDMPPPRFDWQAVPLAEARDTLRLEGLAPGLPAGAAVSMGNPHLVFFLADLAEIDAARVGAQLERHPLFPERVNVGFAQVLTPERMRLRVFERGVGLTPACGSGACAAMVTARRRGLVGERVRIILDGGELEIAWPDAGPVRMRGPAVTVYEGRLHPDVLGA